MNGYRLRNVENTNFYVMVRANNIANDKGAPPYIYVSTHKLALNTHLLDYSSTVQVPGKQTERENHIPGHINWSLSKNNNFDES